MKDIREELRKLGDALATLLGCAVLAVGVVVVIAIVMRAIYYRPPEERGDGPSRGGSRGPGIAVQLSTNPTYKWHPSNVYHR